MVFMSNILCCVAYLYLTQLDGRLMPLYKILLNVLLGVFLFLLLQFACSPRVHKGFPPLRTPQKNMQKEQNTPVRP